MQGVDNPEIEFYYVMNDTLQELIMIVDENCNEFQPGIPHTMREVDVKPPCAQ
jgi:hypothetical protein